MTFWLKFSFLQYANLCGESQNSSRALLPKRPEITVYESNNKALKTVKNNLERNGSS